MIESAAPAAGADAARDEGLNTVADAVAELERREQSRRAERKAEKAKAAEAESDDEDTDVDAEESDDDDKPAKRKAEKDEKAKPKRAESDDEDDDSAEDDAEDDYEDSTDDSAKDDAEDDDEEDDAEDEPKPKKKAEAPAKLKINLGDREVEATPEEASNYVREAHAERQQIAQTRQQIAQQAQQLQQQGQTLARIAQAMIGQEPALELAQTDPGTYIAQQAQYRQRLAVLQQLQGHTTQASQIAQAQQQQAFAQTVTREREALLKAIPELADPAKLSAFQGRIAKVAQRYGLTAQDLSGAFDHRSYLMLRDLGRLADMEAERASVRKKLKGAPPLKAPEQRASAGQRNTSDVRAKSAKSAFLKSGRTMRDVKAYLDRTER